MADIIVPSSSETEGNASSSVPQCSAALYWAFRLSNYTKDDISLFKDIDSSKVPILVFQEETCPTTGTPHLQGAMMFKKKGRPMCLLPHRRTHWELKKPQSTVKQFFDYCLKEETRSGEQYSRGWVIQKPFKMALDLYKWEKVIADELHEVPNDRIINWLWEGKGGVGKTTFQKWIFCNYKKVVVLSGKGADMKNGIINYKEKAGYLPKIVLINVPRSNIDYISFTGLEEIKDMFFFSGKYEGGMVCGACPHVYIFANSQPDRSKMSEDRWRVRLITRLGLVEN